MKKKIGNMVIDTEKDEFLFSLKDKVTLFETLAYKTKTGSFYILYGYAYDNKKKAELVTEKNILELKDEGNGKRNFYFVQNYCAI